MITPKRNRRLRKKLYVGEFTIYGFEASMSFSDIDEDILDTFLDEMVDFVEARNLLISFGGGTDALNAFVCSSDRYGSASDDDRDALSTWLKTKSFIKDIDIDALVDANYAY
ncbi:hypothetical protein PCNPT3_12840 [Psychromonas sp. CNPT3]|uniref:YggL family protein n=1 Tax=Psychromonas sp. CNPT3 TaxID=314282 RepID=UPI00006E4863|nr:YggL family protein [Psychromonas sp. CNPT3]AGH82504.1 hypothetical protein PCNPT3_12840 [Psychromonas sp. CNPT3]